MFNRRRNRAGATALTNTDTPSRHSQQQQTKAPEQRNQSTSASRSNTNPPSSKRRVAIKSAAAETEPRPPADEAKRPSSKSQRKPVEPEEVDDDEPVHHPGYCCRPLYQNVCSRYQNCCSLWGHLLACLGDLFRFDSHFFCPLVLLAILAVYLAAGGFILWIVERHQSFAVWDDANTQMESQLELLWLDQATISLGDFKDRTIALFRQWHRHRVSPYESGWTMGDAIFFCINTSSMCHHNLLMPRTTFGKIFTVVYAAVGIPLYLIVATHVGRIILQGILFVVSIFRYSSDWVCSFVIRTATADCSSTDLPSCSKREQPNCVVMVFSVVMAVFIAILYVLVGSFFLVARSEYSFLDVAFSSFCAFSTIEIAEVFFDSSRTLVYFIYHMGGVAIFQLTLGMIASELCCRLPCIDLGLCDYFPMMYAGILPCQEVDDDEEEHYCQMRRRSKGRREEAEETETDAEATERKRSEEEVKWA